MAQSQLAGAALAQALVQYVMTAPVGASELLLSTAAIVLDARRSLQAEADALRTGPGAGDAQPSTTPARARQPRPPRPPRDPNAPKRRRRTREQMLADERERARLTRERAAGARAAEQAAAANAVVVPVPAAHAIPASAGAAATAVAQAPAIRRRRRPSGTGAGAGPLRDVPLPEVLPDEPGYGDGDVADIAAGN